MYIQIGAHVGTRRIFKLRDSAPDGRSHNRNRRPGDIRIAGVQRYFNVSAAVRLSACGSFLFHCRFWGPPKIFVRYWMTISFNWNQSALTVIKWNWHHCGINLSKWQSAYRVTIERGESLTDLEMVHPFGAPLKSVRSQDLRNLKSQKLYCQTLKVHWLNATHLGTITFYNLLEKCVPIFFLKAY